MLPEMLKLSFHYEQTTMPKKNFYFLRMIIISSY